jgi:ATP/maltotriose-dependent transcriptional regulator MalT/DNA-binding SARP family transcriptional activator
MKRKASITAKLVRPAQPGTVRRPRLFRLLDRARPIAWVSGQPGVGKTTLVASYIEARRLWSLWYQVDENDGDVATFFYYLRQAAMRAAPRKRWRLPVLTPEYLPGLATFARRWFEELFAGLPDPFLLVLDNYQEAPVDSRLHEVLREALETLSKGGRVAVISRSDPPPLFARLRAAGSIILLESDALLLTSEETAAIARTKTRRRVSTDQARALHAATNGWAAGLVLMLEHAASEISLTVPGEHEAQTIFDYFASEILARSDSETQKVLLETALLPKMTAPQAEALTGSPRAGGLLTELTRRRYFVDCHPEPEPTYQYHPLFRDFLMARAQVQLSPDRRAHLQRTAASILERTGQVEDAARLLRQAGDWNGLARIVAIHAPALLAQGRTTTVHGWLRSLPTEALEGSPWLTFWLAACWLVSDSEESLRYATRAFERFRMTGDRAGALSAWSMAVDAIFYGWGDLTRLDPWIALLESMLDERADFPSDVIESRVIASMFTALVWRQLGRPDIPQWAARAEAAFNASPDLASRVRLGHALANYFVWLGDIRKAEIISSALLVSTRRGGTPPLPRLWAMVVESTIAWIMADPHRCHRVVSDALNLARSAGVRIVDDHLSMAWVFGALIDGDVAAAARKLERIRAELDDRRSVSAMSYHYLAGWASMLAGDLPAAHAQAVAGAKFAVQSGGLFSIVVSGAALAQTLYETGELEAARVELEKSLRLAREIRSRIAEFCCLLPDADFGFREGDEKRALASLRCALELGREHGFLTAAWWRPQMVGRLCAKAFEAGIEVDYARRLVQAHHLLPDPNEPPSEAWPWPIRVYALGRFEVQVDGERLTFAGKAQGKPLALLRALVAFGGHETTEQELADALWPDAEGDAAHKTLSVTLHRLRRLLRHEEAIQRQEGRLRFDPTRVWIDVHALDACLKRAGQTSHEPRARLVNAAIQLYRGPLLPGEEDEVWIIAPRERLRARVLRELAELARENEMAGDLDGAVSWYLKALEIDDCAEEFYRRLISVYQRLGRWAEAMALYQRCRSTLSAALGVAPSSETEAIVGALDRSGRPDPGRHVPHL